jgi:uncharacterized lipoprotein YehR (DUF1307 family)
MTKASRLTRLALVVAILPCALLLAGCGESETEKFEKAKAEVCKSRSAIEKQIDSLASLPLSITSLESAKKSLEVIDKELKKIHEEAPKLAPETKKQVESATNEFKSQIDALASLIGSGSFNPTTAKAQGEAALKQLLKSYEATLKKLSCS